MKLIEDNKPAWMCGLARWLPVLDWGRRYGRGEFAGDLLAAAVVTLMLIPQSLAIWSRQPGHRRAA